MVVRFGERLPWRGAKHGEQAVCAQGNSPYITPLRRIVSTLRSTPAVADKFDPYREALVLEEETVWPDELADLPEPERTRVEQALHADPASASHLVYIRTHTGFCRQITVTAEDLQRLGVAAAS